jgi:hypothetical protein
MEDMVGPEVEWTRLASVFYTCSLLTGPVRMEDMVGLEVDWRMLASSKLTGPLQPLHAHLFQQRPAFLPTEAEFLPPSELLLNQAQFHGN